MSETLELRIARADELPDCLEIRRAVFTEGQGVPAELDVDGLDAGCTHLIARSADGPLGTARFRDVGGRVKAERVAVLDAARGLGIGRRLMELLEQETRAGGFAEVVLHAQEGVVEFYTRLGYAAEGAYFMEAGISHVAMTKALGPLSDAALDAARRALAGEDVEEWLALWHASQGGDARSRRFALMARALPFAHSEPLRVLDVCCGPGDLGRAIAARFPQATLDCVDRDPFLLALGDAANRQRDLRTRIFRRDGWDARWADPLVGDYHVVAAATALHWFDEERMAELFRDFYGLLRADGVLLVAEPAAPEPELAEGHRAWWRDDAASYDSEAVWQVFWDRANALLGRDHQRVLESLPAGRKMIGDDGIPVLRYVELMQAAGFAKVDVLLREGVTVTLAALKRGRS